MRAMYLPLCHASNPSLTQGRVQQYTPESQLINTLVITRDLVFLPLAKFPNTGSFLSELPAGGEKKS